MARDNLTEALTRWQDAGVKKEDLAALTLYRDVLNEFVNSGSMLDTGTNFFQMKQGKKTELAFRVTHLIPFILCFFLCMLPSYCSFQSCFERIQSVVIEEEMLVMLHQKRNFALHIALRN